jgi:hypothetical protein
MRYTTRIAALAAVLAVSGCAGKIDAGSVATNPVLIGSVTAASASECQAWAAKNPKQAADVLTYSTPALLAANACLDGMKAGIAGGQ